MLSPLRLITRVGLCRDNIKYKKYPLESIPNACGSNAQCPMPNAQFCDIFYSGSSPGLLGIDANRPRMQARRPRTPEIGKRAKISEVAACLLNCC